MDIKEAFGHPRCEHDEDGIPHFQMRRNAAGKLWRKRLSEEARKQLRVGLFMDDLRIVLADAQKTLDQEDMIFLQDNDETDPVVLQQHWARLNKISRQEINRVQQHATKLSAALKDLFDV